MGTSGFTRIVNGILGVALILGWFALSLDYAILVFGALFCAWIVGRFTKANRTTDWTYGLAGAIGALVSLAVSDALTGGFANFDIASAILAIFVGLCVGGGFMMVVAATRRGGLITAPTKPNDEAA